MQQRELWRREQASKLLLCEAGERGSESIGNRGIGLPRDLQKNFDKTGAVKYTYIRVIRGKRKISRR